jgi:hypothetical protein
MQSTKSPRRVGPIDLESYRARSCSRVCDPATPGSGLARLKLTVRGFALGMTVAFALTCVMAPLLYGVTTTDPLTFAMISLALAGLALLACWIPARRATKVDPLVALSLSD